MYPLEKMDMQRLGDLALQFNCRMSEFKLGALQMLLVAKSENIAIMEHPNMMIQYIDIKG